MKKTLKTKTLGLCAMTVLICPAFAADLPSKGFELGDLRPSVDETSHGSWTGAYVGASVGSAWKNGETRENDVPPYMETLTNKSNADASFIGGVQAGYNYQADELIYGIEGDVSFGARSSWKTALGTPVMYRNGAEQSYLRSKADLNWFGTLRGRLGYAFTDQFMMYGTAGVAVGEVNIKSQGGYTASTALQFAYPSWASSKSFTRFGWTVGIGGEFAFAENWSLKGEYLRIDLGSKSFSPVNGVSMRQRTTADIVRLGLNYRFQ